MCGIVGVLSLDEQHHVTNKTLVNMTDIMSHRGPDGEGFFFGREVDESFLSDLRLERPAAIVEFKKQGRPISLGHRRLSIIDLDAKAGQPMSNQDGSIWIVFNGEIYNHKEIRIDLEKIGYQFNTDHSDTETIIYAYEEWGIDAIHRFRGMFAIALWDEKKDTLWLVRDRIGIKPLYYTIYKNKLYFASEIKAILQDKSIPREINEEGLYNYLSFLTVPAPQTLFKDIYKLPAGHRVKIQSGIVSNTEQYWDVFDNVENHNGKSDDEIMNELIRSLRTSVKYRGESDVPVGVFLSGGVDSSTNAALFSENSDYKVKAFSIGYQNDELLKSYKNEFEFAKIAAKHANCEYYQKELTQEDLINFLPKLVHYQDEPIADPVCVPLYFVAKLAKENGVSVAQVGEGADELFGGYQLWQSYLNLQNIDDLPLPALMKGLGLKGLDLIGKGESIYYELLRRGNENQRIFWGGAGAFNERQKDRLISENMKERFKNYSSWNVIEQYYEKFRDSAPDQSNLNWMTYMELKMRLPELLLMRVDKMSMANSLEGRVPFLDHEFVQFSMGVSPKLKIKKGQSKHILKKSVEGIIPNELIYRKKQGFGAPVYEWFFQELGVIAKEKINKFNSATGYFDVGYINELYRNGDGVRVWYLLNLALWWEEYIL